MCKVILPNAEDHASQLQRRNRMMVRQGELCTYNPNVFSRVTGTSGVDINTNNILRNSSKRAYFIKITTVGDK
jgi:hypothetical protein